ncbi:MAG: DUF2089 domain-containing protein [candidate division Zixibacteria bacterium]|nr:DUF2089 domain-containing protein [candidate division Zixibacteria bacterium]
MAKDWQELTKLTGDEPIVVERVRLTNKDIAIEGSFELPPLAQLTMEDQIFAAAFVQSHGSIKEMERLFGVSYPTIKSRLNKIGDQLDFVEVQNIELAKLAEPAGLAKLATLATPTKPIELEKEQGQDVSDILDRLESGMTSAKEALEILKSGKNKKENK